MGVLQVPDLVVQSSGELIGVWSGRGDVNQFVHVVDGDVVGIRFGWETDGWSSINLWVTGCRITGGLIIEGHQITHAGVQVGGLHFDDVNACSRLCNLVWFIGYPRDD